MVPGFETRGCKTPSLEGPLPTSPWACVHMTGGALSLVGVSVSHPGGERDQPVELLELYSGPQTGGALWALSSVLPLWFLFKIDFHHLKKASLFHTAGSPPLQWCQVSLCGTLWGVEQYPWLHPLDARNTPSLKTIDIAKHDPVCPGGGTTSVPRAPVPWW